MTQYTKEMNAYLAKVLPRGEVQDLPRLLDELYYLYLDISGRDPEPVKRCYQELDKDISFLPHPQQDRICCTVDRLCSEQQRAAFHSGMQMGARLMLELQDQDQL